MCRPFTLLAEVFTGFDQASAEIHLPEAIYSDASDQGIFRRRHPLRKANTIVGSARGQRWERGWDTWADKFAGLIVSAPQQHVRLFLLAAFGHDHHRGKG